MAVKRRTGRRIFDITEAGGLVVNVGSSGGSDHGFDRGDYGTLTPSDGAVDGATINAIVSREGGGAAWFVLLAGSLTSNHFTSVDIQHSGGTITLNTVDASFTDFGSESQWQWDPGGASWGASDTGLNYDVEFTL